MIQNHKHYTCTTRYSLLADWFHNETCGHFAFIWYWTCEISYWSEILTSVQQPWPTTGVNSRQSDSRQHDILWWYHVNKCRAMSWTEWTSSGTRLAQKLPGIMLTPPNGRLQKGLAEVKINIIIKLFYRLNIIVWENSQHFVTLPLVSQGNDVWRMSAEMTYSISQCKTQTADCGVQTVDQR